MEPLVWPRNGVGLRILLELVNVDAIALSEILSVDFLCGVFLVLCCLVENCLSFKVSVLWMRREEGI